MPDWIVVPGGNLGNSSAFGKAFAELREIGLIDRVPRLAVINAAGANTLYELYERRGLRWNGGRPDQSITDTYYAELDASHKRASTIASAIEINRPVNLDKCLRALDVCDGVVREVTDQEILDAKAQVGAGGLGCEPASAASVAGREAARRRRRDRARRARGLHPHRPSAQRPDGHGRLSHDRPGAVQQGAGQPRRPPRRLRQPRRRRAQRTGRNHQGDPCERFSRGFRAGFLTKKHRVEWRSEHASHPKLGADAGVTAGVSALGVPLASTVSAPLDVVIDFSVPQATADILAACQQRRIPLVLATTGLDAGLQEKRPRGGPADRRSCGRPT